MQYYKTNYLPSMPTMPGDPNISAEQSQKDDEERRKKLAAIAGMITGLPIGGGTEAAQDYSLSGQQAPVVDSQPPVAVNQPVPPTAVEQPVQQPVAQTEPSTVAQPAVPSTIQLTPENTQELAAKAGVTSSVSPEQVQLPTPGPAVQVAGTQPGAGVSAAANATVPGTGLKAPAGYQPYVDQFKSGDLYSLANPKSEAPNYIKTAAQEQLLSDFQEKKAQVAAQQKVDTAIAQVGSDPNKVMKLFDEFKRGKTEDSSWASIYLLKKFGFDEAANEELAKKGYGARFEHVTLPGGTPAMIKFTPKGEPLSGITETGQQLTAKDLIGVSPIAKHVSTTADVYIEEGTGNRFRSQTDEKGGARLVNIQTGETFRGDPKKLQRQADVSSMARVDYGLASDLLKKHSGNVLDMMKEYETIKGAMTPEARAEFMQRYGYGSTVSKPGTAGTMPIVGAAAGGAGAADENAKALARAQGDVAGTDRQIAELSRLPDTDKTKQQRIAILQQEKAAAQQRVQQLGGAVQGLPAGKVAAGVGGSSIEQEKADLALRKKQEEERIQVAGQRSQAFNKILDEEVRPQAQSGDTIVSTRKQQFQLFDRPGVDMSKIFGIANGAGQAPGDQRWTMIRDTLLGKTTASADDIRQRAAQLGLNREEQAALAEYAIANAKINAATLKATAGPGSVSDAEQRANREMNVDPTKIPGLGAYNAMAQSQFEGDKARYKADWAESHPATNALQLDKAWRKESQRLTEIYTNIAKQRAQFINENGATTAAVKEGYKRYPIPEYDPSTESWKKTKPLAEILGK